MRNRTEHRPDPEMGLLLASIAIILGAVLLLVAEWLRRMG